VVRESNGMHIDDPVFIISFPISIPVMFVYTSTYPDCIRLFGTIITWFGGREG